MDLLESFHLPTCSFSNHNKNPTCLSAPGWCSGWKLIAFVAEKKKWITSWKILLGGLEVGGNYGIIYKLCTVLLRYGKYLCYYLM